MEAALQFVFSSWETFLGVALLCYLVSPRLTINVETGDR